MEIVLGVGAWLVLSALAALLAAGACRAGHLEDEARGLVD